MIECAGPHGIEVTWLGHASVLIDLEGIRILLDPVVRCRVAHLRRREPVDARHLGDIDAVFVSHAHHDHLDIGSLRRIRRVNPDVRWIAPRGAARAMERAGITPVERCSVGSTTEIGGVQVRTVVAQHGGERIGKRLGEAGAEAVGFILQAGDGPRIWFAGDTELDGSLEVIAPVDVALVPVGGWWRSLGPGHMNSEEAAQAVQMVGARIAVPIHWGTFHPILLFRMMAGMWNQPALQFERAMRDLVPEVDARILPVGGTTMIDVSEPTREETKAWP